MTTDFRTAFRSIARRPALYALVIFPSGIAIAAVTLALGVVSALFLRGAPGVQEPHRLVQVYTSNSADPYWGASYSDYLFYREHNQGFSQLATSYALDLSLRTADQPERVQGLLVTGSYFSTLGVRPLLGHLFLKDDAEPVAVLSHRLWRQRFASSPETVGRSVVLNGRQFLVVGVMPEGFRGESLLRSPDLWIPIGTLPWLATGPIPRDLLDQEAGWFVLLGRLRPGIELRRAEQDLQSLAHELDASHPRGQPRNLTFLTKNQITLGPRYSARASLFAGLLTAAAGLILLVVCVNSSCLLLARAEERRPELALRLSLGASRRSLIRQILTESILLGLASGLLGLWAAWAARPLVLWLDLPLTVFDVRLDLPVLLFALLVSQLAALAAGLGPALAASRQELASESLKERAPEQVKGRRFGPRHSLMVVQAALALPLLVTAGLFLRTLYNLRSEPLGFTPRDVFVTFLDLGFSNVPPETVTPFFDHLLESIESLPGVRAASLASQLPFETRLTWIVSAEGDNRPLQDVPVSPVLLVGEKYFNTLGIQWLAGRDFSRADGPGAPGVAIVNRALATRLWPGRNALGRRLSLGGAQGPFFEVIGVVENSRTIDLRQGSTPTLYLSHRQHSKSPLGAAFASSTYLLVRTGETPLQLGASLRRRLQSEARDLPVGEVRELAAYVDAATKRERQSAVLMTLLAALALGLTSLGIYGIVAQSVARRTREIGVRMALGARRGGLLGMVFKEACLMVGLGGIPGLAAAFWSSSLLQSQIYGIAANDGFTYVAAGIVLLGSAILASLIPGRRALKVQPAAALRGN